MTQTLAHLFRKAQLPVILQGDVAECGLACIAMILCHHGKQTDLVSIRQEYNVSTRGTSLRFLMEVAGDLGLISRPLRTEIESLKYINLPCMLHWNHKHFVVLKEIRGKKYILHDPALGLVNCDEQELSENFTGVVIESTPAVDFKPIAERKTLSLTSLWEKSAGLTSAVIRVVLLGFLLQCLSIILPLFQQLAVDEAIANRDSSMLIVLVLGFGSVFLVNGILKLLRSLVVIDLSNQFSLQINSNLFRHLLSLPLRYFGVRHIGDIQSRFNSFIPIQSLFIQGLPSILIDGLTAPLLIAFMAFYSFDMVSVTCISVILCSVLIRVLTSKARLLEDKSIRSLAESHSIFIETVRGIAAVKNFGKESTKIGEWSNSLASSINASSNVSRIREFTTFFQEVIYSFEFLIIFYIGAHEVIDGNLTLGMLLAFLAIRLNFNDKLSRLLQISFDIRMLRIHLDRISDLTFTEPEVSNVTKNVPFRDANGSINADGIYFRYGAADPYILEGFNIHIESGQHTVLIGPSGSGKSTLFRLLSGQLFPGQGSISVDNIKLERFGLANFRKQTGIINQGESLFPGTIAQNICFFDEQPSQVRIEECAKIACVDEEILGMPMGYNTLLGETGLGLSGGQVQKVLIARALYSNPKFLFIDEGTSNLDITSERKVSQNIAALGITRISVAHRPEVIQSADIVFDMSGHSDS